jgi:hypothetical protein
MYNTIGNYKIILSFFATNVCRQGMNYTSLSFFVTFVQSVTFVYLKSTLVDNVPKPNPYEVLFAHYIIQIEKKFIDSGLENVVEDL